MDFQKVGILGQSNKPEVLTTITRLVKFLVSHQLTIFTTFELTNLDLSSQINLVNRKQLGALCDLVIVVGGDGSLIGAARDLAPYKVAVLGINRGYLGFLTDIVPKDLESQLLQVLKGTYQSEQRFLLEACICRGENHINVSSALNDVVLHPGESAKMMELEIYIT